MTAAIHYTHGPAFSVVEVTALAFLEHAEPALQEIARRTRQHGDRRLLINLLDVVGTFAPDQQRAIGLLACQYLGHLEKVAALLPPEKITGASEAAAPAQGTQMKVFPGLADAIGWLVS